MNGWRIGRPGQIGLPEGVLHIDYNSSDGLPDWALLLPPTAGSAWVVNIHGHGSGGDQLYTRADLRERWLPCFTGSELGILTPNLRGNAWMSPPAASDLEKLLGLLRAEFGAERFIFAGGSMGGTSSLIYAALRPGDAAGIIALGAVSDLAEYHGWCRSRNTGVLKEIADAIEASYGPPESNREAYRAHSAAAHAERLRMPIYLAHGAGDKVMPVTQSRRLAALLKDNPGFVYRELPHGDHDSPLVLMPEALSTVIKKLQAAPPVPSPACGRGPG